MSGDDDFLPPSAEDRLGEPVPATPAPYQAPYQPPAQYPVQPPYQQPPGPYQPQPPYHAPGAVYPVPVASTNGLAVASLVLGILWVYWLGSILAVIFGHIALSQIAKSGGFQQGRGLAIAGVVLGWIGVGILVLLLILGAAGAAFGG